MIADQACIIDADMGCFRRWSQILKGIFRFLIVLVVIVGVAYAFAVWLLSLSSQSTTTVTLGQTGYNVSYSVSWGTGMDEKVSISRSDGTGSTHKGDCVEIFKKPYNSGMSLYRSDDGNTFYVGQGMGFYRFVPATGEFQFSCRITDFLAYTPLGTAIAGIDHFDVSAVKALDPGARNLQGYLDPNEGGAIQKNPPASRYYKAATFLGKFGILEGGTRGSGVAFVSLTPEPRMGLSGRCP